jgi:hypothetical protein
MDWTLKLLPKSFVNKLLALDRTLALKQLGSHFYRNMRPIRIVVCP